MELWAGPDFLWCCWPIFIRRSCPLNPISRIKDGFAFISPHSNLPCGSENQAHLLKKNINHRDGERYRNIRGASDVCRPGSDVTLLTSACKCIQNSTASDHLLCNRVVQATIIRHWDDCKRFQHGLPVFTLALLQSASTHIPALKFFVPSFGHINLKKTSCLQGKAGLDERMWKELCSPAGWGNAGKWCLPTSQWEPVVGK